MVDANQYDQVLKSLLLDDELGLLGQLLGLGPMAQALNIEFPRVDEKRLDLVMRMQSGRILHLELQSGNHPKMGLRMLDYYGKIAWKYSPPIDQVVLYVGPGRMTMVNHLQQDRLQYSYTMMDIRNVRVDAFLASGKPVDVALALLAGGGEKRLPEILRRAATLTGPARMKVLGEIAILSGLRGLSGKMKKEVNHMPLVDITENEFLMELTEKAHQKGRQEVRAEGTQLAMREILRKMLQRRFGRVPAWAKARITSATTPQLQQWLDHAYDAESLEALVGKR